MPSAESILFKIFILVVVVGGVVIVVLVAPRFLPNPASVTPSTTILDSGQTAQIAVVWKGGMEPYTIDLYSSTSGSCSASSSRVGVEGGLPTPQYMFTVSPTTTTRYCGTVTSEKGSSTISSSVLVTVNPTLATPGISLSASAIDSGQSELLTATVTLSGGSAPYSVTLYGGNSTSCSSDTTVVSPVSPSNPISHLAGQVATFSFSSPGATTYYCAGVTNSATNAAAVMSQAVSFTVNPALSVSVTPTSVTLDSGESAAFTASASGGTLPYTYQWYTGGGCSAAIAGQTNSTFDTGAQYASGMYSVSAGDSSNGVPIATQCATVSIAVNSAFTGSQVSIGTPTLIDSGQSAKLIVDWARAGTGPYKAELTKSAGSACPSIGGAPVATNMTSGTNAEFTVSPTSTTYYCATVVDSALTPESATTPTAVEITVNPALVPTVQLSITAVDSGQRATVSATVTVTGGTPAYSITFRGGSSASCGSDAVIGTTSLPSATFTFSAPASTEDYCAVVVDSAPSPNTVSSPIVKFTVNPVLSVTISPASPSVESGKEITLTATVSGGTSPYVYQWYTGNSCASGHQIAGATASTYDINPATTTGNYSVHLADSSTGTPADTACASTEVVVTPALVATLSLTPEGKDTGQTVTVTATIDLSGGKSPYSVTLHSGPSSTCSDDMATVTVSTGTNPTTGVTASSVVDTFTAPAASTYYCAAVTDSASVPDSTTTSVVEFTVNAAPAAATIKVTPYAVLDSAQQESINATVSWTGGTAPFTVTLESGSSSTCSLDTVPVVVDPAANPQTGVGGSPYTFTFKSPTSSAYLCAVVTDSGSPSETASSATTLFTVNPALSLTAPSLTPAVLDSGVATTVTASVSWSGGTAPYKVTLLAGSSTSCALDTNVVAVAPGFNPETGVSTTSATFTFAPPATTSDYCLSVIDSSGVPVTLLSATSSFTVNGALTATLLGLSPDALDASQSATVTASVAWTGGTAPFSVSLTDGGSSSCSLDTTAVGSAQTSIFGSTATLTFSSPTTTTYYCATISDSSTGKPTSTTASVAFAVNHDPAVAITPSAPTIETGEDSPPLLATATLGTAPYAYQWYTGSSCATPIDGQTSSTYSPGVLASTSTYSVKVTDSSTGTPATDSAACATVTVTAGLGPEGIASNPNTGYVYVANPQNGTVSVIDSVANPPYVVVSIPTGSHPWGVALNTTAACVADVCWGTLYVTNYLSGSVTVINASDNAVITTITIPLPSGCAAALPEGLAVSPTVRQLYVADSGCNTVSVIDINPSDASYDTVTATIAVGGGPQSVSVGASPYTVFVADYGSDTVSVITLTFNPTLSYSVTTETVGNNPWGIAVDQAMDLVYVTNSGSGTVSVLNGTSFATEATISLGSGVSPEGISIDASKAIAYVADAADSSVVEINLDTNALITSASPAVPIPTEANPSGITVLLNPDNPTYPSLAFVTDGGSNTVTVIDLATNEVVATVIVP